MWARGRELITVNKSTIVTKPLLDPVVVQNSQGNRGLSDSASTDEGDWGEVLRSTTFSINSSRPKNVLGGRGGDSPGILYSSVRQ